MDRFATSRVRLPALCAGLVALALIAAAPADASTTASGAAKTKPSAIKKAKKKAVKKTTKAVRAELQSSSEPGLAQPAEGPKIKISSCKQLTVRQAPQGL